MGNCPSEFSPSPGGIGCVAKCPTDKGYEYRVVNGVVKCVYTSDASKSVSLTQLPFMTTATGTRVPIGSYEQVKTSNAPLYKQYADEVTRFNNEIAIINANIDKDKKIAAAFKVLQDAENARDTAPEAYQQARINYYTLVKGTTWLDQEKARIAKADVDPVVNAYTTRYSDVKTRMGQQSQTMDIVNSVKDKLLSVQDDFGKTVGAFSKQLSQVKNQINIERRKKVEEVSSIWEFVDLALNAVLVVALLFAIGAVIQVLYTKWRPQPPAIGQTYTR